MSFGKDPQRAPAPGDAVETTRQGWGERALNAAAGLAAAAILVVVLVQVVSRLRGAPVAWSEELTRAVFVWMVFLGLASSMRTADAARVTVLVEAWPALRRLAVPIYALGCLGFFALMGWTGASMVRQQLVMNETIATLGVPSWIVGLVMPCSALLAAIGTIFSLRDRRDAIAGAAGSAR